MGEFSLRASEPHPQTGPGPQDKDETKNPPSIQFTGIVQDSSAPNKDNIISSQIKLFGLRSLNREKSNLQS